MNRSWRTQRYEIKYLVSQAQLPDLRQKFLQYMRYDSNVDPETRGYFNHSIYFDSPRLHYYLEKHEGLKSRIKPRLRAYRATSDGPPTGLFLELKSRSERVVFKQRDQVTADFAQRLLNPSRLAFDDEIANSETLSRFYYILRRFSVTPQVTVLYHREAFQSDYFPGLRVTFDSRLQSSNLFTLDASPSAFRYVIPADTAVLEIKFNKKIPGIVLDDIRHFGLSQVTFSKFATSLEANMDCVGNVHRVYGAH